MRRRSRAGGEPIKTRRRKAMTLKPRNAPEVVRRRGPSTIKLQEQLKSCTRELNETREREGATSEVLRVISRSSGELRPVFDAILDNAVRICGAQNATLWLQKDGALRRAARHRDVPNPIAPAQPSAKSILVRAVRTKQIIHVADYMADQAYLDGDPFTVAAVEELGVRTYVAVPMLKESDLVGAISVYRTEVRAFTEKQIALLTSFAAQAVIAIENTRLLNELRERTDDLTEALGQQTATSEVLQVISSSPGELEPVFKAMLENATRICDAKFGVLQLLEGDGFRAVGLHNAPPAFADYVRRGLLRPGPNVPLSRMARTKQVVHIADITMEEAYIERDPLAVAGADLGGYRTILAVPMLKESELIGGFVIFRQEVRLFADKQIKLVQNFAAQAVIAIENARLLSELRQRTDDLTESLEQQTATSEVLQVISSSPGELQPVFDAILDNAVRICASQNATLWLQEDGALRRAARHREVPDAIVPSQPSAISVLARAVRTKQIIHIQDYRTDQSYLDRDPFAVAAADQLGIRTNLSVPMLKEGEPIGAISIFRTEIRPFTEKQIELIASFASQAVIAIENARLLNELRQRTTDLTERSADLTEALEQQTATSEVLRVISRSPGDLKPVFQTMLENATRICEAKFGTLFRFDGKSFYPAADVGTPPELSEYMGRPAFQPLPGGHLDRVLRTKQLFHTADDTAEAVPGPAARLAGARSTLCVPMLKDDALIGAIVIYRQEVRPFTDKQIELLTNFAAQAAIAIENTRLLNELRELLQQQTATSEVLQVVSSSPGDLEPVFAAMLEKAVLICDAKFGNIYRWDGDALHVSASYNTPPAYTEERKRVQFRADQKTPIGRMILTKTVVHVDDVRTETSYIERSQPTVAAAELGGVRTLLAVPMLNEGELIGAFGLSRQEVRPFTDKQIALVQNFAAQAVIAIENTRLLNELRESLQQQTATAEVLEVISRSAFDLRAVFETVAESSVRLCGAGLGFIFRFDGELLRLASAFNASQEHKDFVEQNPIRPGRHSAAARAALERRTIHIPDVLADPEYSYGAKDFGVFRTVLGVPILKGDDLLGVIIVHHLEVVRPFTDKQIALVETFADQAAIAIENVRLLDTLRLRTDELGRSVGELRALGEVSQAVNSTLDLETVLSTIVAKAVQLSGTEAGAIYVFDQLQREFHLRATYGMDPELIDALARQHIGFDEPNVELAFAQREPIQVADLREDAPSAANEIVLRAGYRARLLAPLLRGEDVVGMLVVRRRAPGAFPQNTVDLIKTFAAQSVLAIQNARLFENVEIRTGELAKSLEDLRTTQDRLVQTEKLASLGQLTAGIAHEIKNPLNFVNNFSAVSVELIDELREALGGAHLDSKLRAEISDIADTLQGNLDKVVQHGKRADAIVKNMLLHSRQGSGEHRPVDINALVDESLNLAYHGARAEKQGFNITLERSFDPAAGEVDLFPQEITRALLNLISNGFYAATKRKAESNGGDYEPTLVAATRNLGDKVEIRIRDNGTGIPPDAKEKLFNPFFTTKPAGEGTGLGLSISHDIIVKQHLGSIEVDTQPGEFTEFRIVLPRAGAFLIKSGGPM